MASSFVPLSSIKSDAEMKADPFFSEVVQRSVGPKSGADRYPGLWRRLQNPICQQCQAEFRRKYPDRPFSPNCQGIYDEEDFEQIARDTEDTYEHVREVYDTVYWAEKYAVVKNSFGDYVSYSSKDYEYQIPVLRCTAQYQIDRMGRGMGKTLCGVITELQRCMNNKNYEVLVLCPAKAQAQMWFEEIIAQVENSPRLYGALRGRLQQPYFKFTFFNGAKIKIFTAGSKAGRGAVAIRGQSPRRVRLDEQDYLADPDYDAVMALLRRFPDSEFHGSSTPTGARSMYWQMCTQLSEYREFYIPVTMKKGWCKAEELKLRKEAKTAERYDHEYMALFGDIEAGVFKAVLIDAAKKSYHYAEIDYTLDMMNVLDVQWNDCPYDPSRHYVIGCDWNGNGTGSRIRVTEYDPATQIRRCVYKETIDQEGATTDTSLRHIQLLNRIWHCDFIFCDKGFGFAQDELLRKIGKLSLDASNPEPQFRADDQKLMVANFVGSKENLKTNRLVPKRDPNSPLLVDKELERQTKPFMVEGCQIAMEQLRAQISSEDERLEAQMRDYRVKTWSANGHAASYEAKNEGDHDLDAWVLSMLGIELNYGLFVDPLAQLRLAQIVHVPSLHSGVEARIEAARMRMRDQGVPDRVNQRTSEHELGQMFAVRGGVMITPSKGTLGAGVGPTSRTAVFRTAPTSRLFPGSFPGSRRSR